MPHLSVVIPTFNERDNVSLLIGRLADVLAGLDWEVIVVDDDSPDGTALTVRDLAEADRRVRLIHRIGRRGLSRLQTMLFGSVAGSLVQISPVPVTVVP